MGPLLCLRVVSAFPEFRAMGGNVEKHVATVGELSRMVTEKNLMKISELEQGEIANKDPSAFAVRATLCLRAFSLTMVDWSRNRPGVQCGEDECGVQGPVRGGSGPAHPAG